MTGDRRDGLSENRAAYFDMLADMGMTKHIGSLEATDALVQGCHIGSGSLVLDVGCGVGLTPCYLVKTYGCRVVGIDITPKMIVRALAEGERRGLVDALRWGVADAQALPFATESFDAVLVESVSVFLDDIPLGFSEYARVTKPGGYVGVTESTWLSDAPEASDDFYAAIGGTGKTKDAWTAYMRGAGLTDVTGYARAADVREEARGRLKRFGAGGMARAVLGALRLMFGSKRVRKLYLDALRAAPPDVMKLLGYGVFVGQKGH